MGYVVIFTLKQVGISSKYVLFYSLAFDLANNKVTESAFLNKNH